MSFFNAHSLTARRRAVELTLVNHHELCPNVHVHVHCEIYRGCSHSIPLTQQQIASNAFAYKFAIINIQRIVRANDFSVLKRRRTSKSGNGCSRFFCVCPPQNVISDNVEIEAVSQMRFTEYNPLKCMPRKGCV